MKEKLIIKNFGPIKSVELELGRVNVLIGEQGTGKSTVAKLISSIYSLMGSTEVIPSGVIELSKLKSFQHFKNHLSVYEIHNYLKPNTNIQFQGKEITFSLNEGEITYNPEDLIKLNRPQPNSPTYIPADRIATPLFSSATWTSLIDIEEGRMDMPKYFLRFINLLDRLKRLREYDFTEILGLKFRQDNGIDKIVLKDGSNISPNESASAVQANLSLCTIIDWQFDKGDNKHITFIIEEPELNMFPSKQNKLMQYLVDKTINYGNSMILTTHSPYILASLNNLMEAYKTGKIDSEETNKIIEKKYWINPDDVCAYMMLADGHCEDIFDREEGLIKAEKIDDVSNILNEQFTSLLNIEFAKHELNT